MKYGRDVYFAQYYSSTAAFESSCSGVIPECRSPAFSDGYDPFHSDGIFEDALNSIGPGDQRFGFDQV